MNKADKCGEWSLTSGYWDYCIYQDSAKPEYVSKTWEEKTDEIMTKVTAEQSTGTFPSTASNFYSTYPLASMKFLQSKNAFQKNIPIFRDF